MSRSWPFEGRGWAGNTKLRVGKAEAQNQEKQRIAGYFKKKKCELEVDSAKTAEVKRVQVRAKNMDY